MKLQGRSLVHPEAGLCKLSDKKSGLQITWATDLAFLLKKSMKYLILLVGCLTTYSLFGQFGVQAAYVDAQVDEWQTGGSDPAISLPGAGWQVGFDYRFPFNGVRIELLPTLAYQRRQHDYGIQSAKLESVVQSVGLFLPLNFYLLDLQGDCDCPTFSKQGPALQKGLYLQLSPGLSYFDFQLSDNALELRDNELNASFGLALGLDIGLSDAIVLSPFAGVRYYPALEWSSLGQPAAEAFSLPASFPAAADVLDFNFGIRVGMGRN